MKTKKAGETPKGVKVFFTYDELYAIERSMDNAYTQLLYKVIDLDHKFVEIKCAMKEGDDQTRMLKRNQDQEEIVSDGFLLYHGISKKCEELRKNAIKQ